LEEGKEHFACDLLGDLAATDGAERDPEDGIDVLIVYAVELV
jgi:hypothetical protein